MESRDPSRGFINVFTVVEEAKHRQRLIHWTKPQNEAAYTQHNYKCEIDDLQHISNFLPAVYTDCAGTADIHASFYHVELPPEARAFYRFRDTRGDLYQLRVGAMGHCIMPEIMQMITNVLAGNPRYVRDEFAVNVPVTVWIDNVRHHGTRALVESAQRALKRNADELGLEVTIDPVRTKYDFIGVAWNHEDRTVRVAEKTILKLPQVVPDRMPAREIEEFLSRLLFTTSVRQTPLVNHWWCLKWGRRVMNGLNTGRLSNDTAIPIPPSAVRSLQSWLDEARRPHKVVLGRDGRHATLFTDATPQGWGGVLVCDDGRVHGVGGQFKANQRQGPISAQEAWAPQLALRAFTPLFRDQNITQLDLLVDNTSVEHTLQKGNTSCEHMVEPIRRFWQQSIRTHLRVRLAYISTAVNPADSLSRGLALDIGKVEQAMRLPVPNSRRGEGRFVGPEPSRK